jgi:hypothetical protein
MGVKDAFVVGAICLICSFALGQFVYLPTVRDRDKFITKFPLKECISTHHHVRCCVDGKYYIEAYLTLQDKSIPKHCSSKVDGLTEDVQYGSFSKFSPEPTAKWLSTDIGVKKIYVLDFDNYRISAFERPVFIEVYATLVYFIMMTLNVFGLALVISSGLWGCAFGLEKSCQCV